MRDSNDFPSLTGNRVLQPDETSLQFHLLHVIPGESPKQFCPLWGTCREIERETLIIIKKVKWLCLILKLNDLWIEDK